jgi:hypothetical protein
MKILHTANCYIGQLFGEIRPNLEYEQFLDLPAQA